MASVIAGTATGREIVEAATERRVGAPVYLRYAAEIAPTEDVVEAAAAAAEFAREALGPPVDVYAVAAGRGGGQEGGGDEVHHLALTVRHEDGSVALLGIGRRDSAQRPVPASILLLGDRGVVEGCPAPALPGTAEAASAGGAAERGARAQLAAAIWRSLQSGRPEQVRSDG